MKALVRVSLIIALGGTLACGKSEEEKRAEELQKAAEQMQNSAGDVQKGAEEMAKGIEAFAKGLAGGAGGTGDQKPVDPIDFKVLQSVLPDMAGWERAQPTGERMTMPVSFSSASVRYTKGDAEVDEKITDSGFNQLLVAPFAMMLTTGYAKETSDGFERSTTVAGMPAFEKWDSSAKRGELMVFVNKRFMVEIDGDHLTDSKDLHAFLERTDLRKLADLK